VTGNRQVVVTGGSFGFVVASL